MFPAFDLFGKTIGTYTLAALVGAFAAGLYVCRSAKKRGRDVDELLVFLLVAALGALVGSHVLFGLTNLPLLTRFITHLNQVGSVQEFFQGLLAVFGGAVFYGGLLGGIAAAFLYARKTKIDLLSYADLMAPAVPLMHVFGRIGCFLGGCCYGVECKLGVTYTNSLVPAANGVSRFPIQLVEAACNLLLFFLLAKLLERGAFEKRLFFVYLFLYSTVRFLLEFWRGDEIRGFVLGISTSQLISVLLFALSVCVLIPIFAKKKEKGLFWDD